MDKSEIVKYPIFFNRNRVGRIYTGGKLFSDFFGDDPIDNFLPEEWICSSTLALNEGSTIENEGLSTVRDTDILFKDLLSEYKKEMIGDRNNFDVLVKLLDSAIRLPIQAHPDREYSLKYLNSSFGKAESWVILGTRENACLYFGFRNKMTKEEFKAAVLKSYDEPNCMEPLLNRIPVKKGEVYLVPAKTVHAIGAGCFILETQEPSDFTIQPEAWCAGERITERTMYLGLEPDIAIDVFDFDIYGDKAASLAKITPKTVYNENGVKREILISYKDTPCFAVNRLLVETECSDFTAPAIYIVTDGEGFAECKGKRFKIKKGDYFFAPYSIKDHLKIIADIRTEIIECLPKAE